MIDRKAVRFFLAYIRLQMRSNCAAG